MGSGGDYLVAGARTDLIPMRCSPKDQNGTGMLRFESRVEYTTGITLASELETRLRANRPRGSSASYAGDFSEEPIMHTTTKQGTAVGVFRDEDRAQEAVRALRQAGFTESQISVVSRHNPDGTPSDAAGGAASGAASLWSLGISFGFIPVIGPILAAGPIAAALLSAAGGGGGGGIVGSLVGMGMSEDDATYYEDEFKSGRTLVTVKDDDRTDDAWSILQRHGAYSRDTAATDSMATAASTGTARTSKTGETVRLHQATEKGSGTVRKEELRVEEKGDPNVRTNDPARTAKTR